MAEQTDAHPKNTPFQIEKEAFGDNWCHDDEPFDDDETRLVAKYSATPLVQIFIVTSHKPAYLLAIKTPGGQFEIWTSGTGRQQADFLAQTAAQITAGDLRLHCRANERRNEEIYDKLIIALLVAVTSDSEEEAQAAIGLSEKLAYQLPYGQVEKAKKVAEKIIQAREEAENGDD
jgi:hypothetical protein